MFAFYVCLRVLLGFWLRLGMLIPMLELFCSAFAEVVRSFVNLRAFYDQRLVQVGSVLPHTSAAVYFRHWCVICQCDGPNLFFCFGWTS